MLPDPTACVYETWGGSLLFRQQLPSPIQFSSLRCLWGKHTCTLTQPCILPPWPPNARSRCQAFPHYQWHNSITLILCCVSFAYVINNYNIMFYSVYILQLLSTVLLLPFKSLFPSLSLSSPVSHRSTMKRTCSYTWPTVTRVSTVPETGQKRGKREKDRRWREEMGESSL